MTDTLYLENLIFKSGKKKAFLAKKLGCTRQSFTNKLHNRSSFTAKDISILCSELNITSTVEMKKIFLN